MKVIPLAAGAVLDALYAISLALPAQAATAQMQALGSAAPGDIARFQRSCK